jgi:tetrapyrrole methylase family protein/MazG family protein
MNMHTITVLALGPGSPDLLTIGALKQMKSARIVILRTARHPAVPFLKEEGIRMESLDGLYDESADFNAFTEAAAGRLLYLAERSALTYAVPDPGHDETVRLLVRKAGEKVRLLPGVPLETPLLLRHGLNQQVLVSSATGLTVHNAQQLLAVVELDNKALAGEVKLKLLTKYGEAADVMFYPPSKALERKGLLMQLVDLDRQLRYDHTCGFVIFPTPLLDRTRFDAEDLLAIMRRLRARDGCPWDHEQTHQSLAKHLVEEANEAACALLDSDWAAAVDELGDVFLQLAFHAVIGEEQGTMTWEDMLQAVCQKLIRRHPHVFGEGKARTAEEALSSWNDVKKQERGSAPVGERMAEVPRGLTPLMRAEKVQKIAAKVGFDWAKPEEALDKVLEEAQELMEALKTGRNVPEELGDLLFSVVNIARMMELSADQTLHYATEKFISRFSWMEKTVNSDKKSLDLLTINEIGVYWERSKTEML